MDRRLIRLALLLLVAVPLIIPFKTTVVPAWSIRVIDESGEPYVGMQVRQSWKHYTFDLEPGAHINDALTDHDGYVTFPERTITFSLLSRAGRSLFTAIMTMAHGSYGIRAEVYVGGEKYFKSVRYVPGKPMPDKLIVPRREASSNE